MNEREAQVIRDLKDKCKATIEFGDDFGDNITTFHCRLEKGHTGSHCETGHQQQGLYVLSWVNKEKK